MARNRGSSELIRLERRYCRVTLYRRGMKLIINS